jgi:Cu2+-containing amine oxidase
MRCVVKEDKLHKIRVRGVLLGTVLITLLLCALALRFGALPILSSSLLTVESSPTGYDPLTAQEVDAVVAAALQAEGEEGARATAAGKVEVLLVERREASKAAYASGQWQRQGDVYVYDYATETLIHTTVDVQSQAVVAVERVQGVQLPLTAGEVQRALALVQADSALWTALAARYQAISSEPLQQLDQLQGKVSVFYADVMPDRLNAAAQQCGQHRCAQVLLFTVDKTLLELMPIVDLSRGEVVQTLAEE